VQKDLKIKGVSPNRLRVSFVAPMQELLELVIKEQSQARPVMINEIRMAQIVTKRQGQAVEQGQLMATEQGMLGAALSGLPVWRSFQQFESSNARWTLGLMILRLWRQNSVKHSL